MTTKDILLNTGKNLKKLIKDKGYTQERFANEIMYVDPVTVRRWIANGITNTETLIEIAKFFDISFEELFK